MSAIGGEFNRSPRCLPSDQEQARSRQGTDVRRCPWRSNEIGDKTQALWNWKKPWLSG